MKACASFIFMLFAIAGYTQNTIDSYKYVLVPEKFDFNKYEDEYGLNTTAKQLLEKKGFVAFLGNEKLPQMLAANKCNALRVEVTQRKSLFVLHLTMFLKDCQGNTIFKSKEGKSTEKDWQVAYEGALRDAFTSLDTAHYKFDSTGLAQAQQIAATPTPAPAVSSSAAAPVSAVASPVSPATSQGSPATSSAVPTATEITGTLYAQPTPNGYQLGDTTPKKIITLLKTTVQDYFIADAGGKNGIVFKRNGEWFFECYEDNKLTSRKLNIKF